MTIEEIMSGESEYLEFKQMVPEKSETYMKTVVAFANGHPSSIQVAVYDNRVEVTLPWDAVRQPEAEGYQRRYFDT